MGNPNLSKILLAAVFTFFASVNAFAQAQESNDVLFQTSIVDALIQGDYDGSFTFGELKEKGDFGLGTFNHLDGELVGFDGVFYQVKSDGSVHIATDVMNTPFAVVTFFESDIIETIDKPLTCEEFKEYLVTLFPTQNIFYGIKVKGDFSYIKARSVPKQKKPYPPLTEVAKEEAIFEFNNINGTFAGFWLPEYLKDINVTGFHFHFISDDKKSGGHVLECKLKNVQLEIDYIRDIQISLPDTKSYNAINLNKTTSGDVKKVEEVTQPSSKEQK